MQWPYFTFGVGMCSALRPLNAKKSHQTLPHWLISRNFITSCFGSRWWHNTGKFGRLSQPSWLSDVHYIIAILSYFVTLVHRGSLTIYGLSARVAEILTNTATRNKYKQKQ